MQRPLPSLSLAVKVACTTAALTACGVRAGPVVTAPSLPSAAVSEARGATSSIPPSGSPAACGQSWALEDASSSSAQVLVVCGNDVRRQPVAAGPMTRALDPALEVAHERVCACASRLSAPTFVDLVLTSVPADGHASIEPSDPDASLDPDVAAGFLACVGKIPVPFAPFSVDECAGSGKTTYVYSLNIELSE